MCHVDNFFGEGVKGPGPGWVEERESVSERRERENAEEEIQCCVL